MSEIQHTTGSAAKELNCSLSLVRYLLDQGKIPFVRLANGQRIMKQEDIDKLKEERAKDPNVTRVKRKLN